MVRLLNARTNRTNLPRIREGVLYVPLHMLQGMSKVNISSVIQDIVSEANSPPSETSIALHLMKWKETGFYEDDSLATELMQDILVSHSLEHLRRQIVALDESINSYFENNTSQTDEFYIDFDGTTIDWDVNLNFIQKYVREFVMTPHVVTFYNYYVEQMKKFQASLLMGGVFNRPFDEQEEAEEFLYSQLSYDQREQLLYWSGIIDDDLRSDMARIRSRRNNLIHSLEAGYSEYAEYSISDLDLCVQTMQKLADLSNRRTALGRLDSIVEHIE